LPVLCTEGFLAAVSCGHDEGAVVEAMREVRACQPLCTDGFLAAVSYGHDEGAVAEATEASCIGC